MTLNERLAQKYPDTDTFHFHNANPKGKRTGDCAVRAICTVLNQSWDVTLKELTDVAIKTGWMVNTNECIDKYMKSKGYICCKQPRKSDNTKYTGQEFCRTLMHPIYSEDLNLTDKSFEINRILANIGGHHIVAIMSGQVWDIWNSTQGTIGKIWVKTC